LNIHNPASIYLDYAATTPLDPRVLDAMLPFMSHVSGFGNPSSAHADGKSAAGAVASAAAEVAGVINASADEIIWTSGATESNNLAIAGAAQFRSSRGKHLVTAATEHKSVLATCAWLETQGFAVTRIKPDADGLISKAELEAALRPDTVLVSLMHANNEIGVVQNIAAFGDVCRTHDILLHVDAVQAAGRLAIDVAAQKIDLLSLNAHKACGPKGVGALYLNAERIRRVDPGLFGGGQQRGLRPGTLPTHQIVGMGAALSIANDEMSTEVARVAQLRDRLWEQIAQVPGTMLNGHAQERLCSILNVSVAGVEGESLRHVLAGLAVASGSACNSATNEPSYVLGSLGRSDALAEASIRFSMGRFSTADEIDRAAEIFISGVKFLQSLSHNLDAGIAA
jgi:cysteine desulfurase